jgi:uncharacterized membrane protein
MTESGYRKRLAEDLPRWREAGWVTPEGATQILASFEGRRSTFGLAAIVGVLGALLLGAGVIAFVGANWEYMPRIFRFALLIAALGIAYGAAALLAAREYRVFAEAALLVAGLVFAASIALIGQTYHLAGDFSGAILFWQIGIVGAALMTGSATLVILSLAGAGYWCWMNVVDLDFVPHWESLALILIGGAIAVWIRSHYARIVAVLALGFWIGVNLFGFAELIGWSPFEALAVAVTLALLFWAVGAALVTVEEKHDLGALGHAMLWPGIAAVLAATAVLQTAPDWDSGGTTDQWIVLGGLALIGVTALVAVALMRKGLAVVDAAGAVVIGVAAMAYAYLSPEGDLEARLAGGVIVLGAALWAVNLGQTGSQRVGKKTGLAAFGLEVVYLYVVTLGGILETAAAFLIGGFLFIGLAYGLVRIDRRLAAARTPSPEGAA